MGEHDRELSSRYVQAIRNQVLGADGYALLDFPDHNNVGDAAIYLGELEALHIVGAGAPLFVNRVGLSLRKLDLFCPVGPILLHGGGNFGDIWRGTHSYRLEVLHRYRDRRIVQLPQSIHFRKNIVFEETVRAIGQHRNFHLMVRDNESYSFAQKHFDCDVELVPDAAHALTGISRKTGSGILTIARDDRERDVDGLGASMKAFGHVTDWPDKQGLKSRTRDGLSRSLKFLVASTRASAMRERERAYHARARQRFDAGIDLLTSARTIVSDRLHAHILSELAGKRHYVLDNNYGKVSSYIETWGASELTTLVSSMSDLLGHLQSEMQR